jgi:hypothetical protein
MHNSSLVPGSSLPDGFSRRLGADRAATSVVLCRLFVESYFIGLLTCGPTPHFGTPVVWHPSNKPRRFANRIVDYIASAWTNDLYLLVPTASDPSPLAYDVLVELMPDCIAIREHVSASDHSLCVLFTNV